MEHKEFEKLAIAELDAVYRFARFLTRDAAVAEELVQDVYARAFRPDTIANFQPQGAGMRAWLMTIARMSFYGRIEHERVVARAMDKVAQTVRSRGDTNEVINPHEANEIDWGLANNRVHKALDSLSVELRNVLWLWAVEGLKYREIAESLDVPIGTVMSRLHRARTQTSRVLREDPDLAPQLSKASIIEPQQEVPDRVVNG